MLTVSNNWAMISAVTADGIEHQPLMALPPRAKCALRSRDEAVTATVLISREVRSPGRCAVIRGRTQRATAQLDEHEH